MNKLLLIMTTFLLFLGACSSKESNSSDLELDDTEETVEVKEVTQEAEEIIEEIEEVEEEFEIEESISPEDEREIRTLLALAIMEKNFDGTAIIDYDEENDAITILPTDPEFARAVVSLQTGAFSMDNWYELRDSYVVLSEQLKNAVGEGIIIALLNPSSPDKTILTLVDGFVLYDVFD